MDQDEKLSAIIGIRVRPSAKKEFREMAEKRGETLSHFVWNLILAGINADVQHQHRDEGMLNKGPETA